MRTRLFIALSFKLLPTLLRLPLLTVMLMLALATLSSGGGTRTATAEIEPRDNPVFPADAELKCVFSRAQPIDGGLTEGPAVAPDGSIYFTDLPFGRRHDTTIHRFDPATRAVSVFTTAAGKANGLAFDADGRLLAADGADGAGRCIVRYDLGTGRGTIVADRFDGRRLNAPNDLCVDRHDRIYFTDPFYVGDEVPGLPTRAVYRVDRDGTVIEITRDVEMPNGIVLSPDGLADRRGIPSNVEFGVGPDALRST